MRSAGSCNRADLAGHRSAAAQMPNPPAAPAISVHQDAEFVGIERGATAIAAHGDGDDAVRGRAPRAAGRAAERAAARHRRNPCRRRKRSAASALRSGARSKAWSGSPRVRWDELDRALRGLLDSYSHRLDAWFTSLATRRLGQLRTSAPSGCPRRRLPAGSTICVRISARQRARATSTPLRSRRRRPPPCCVAGTSRTAATARARSTSISAQRACALR